MQLFQYTTASRVVEEILLEHNVKIEDVVGKLPKPAAAKWDALSQKKLLIQGQIAYELRQKELNVVDIASILMLSPGRLMSRMQAYAIKSKVAMPCFDARRKRGYTRVAGGVK